MKDGKKYLVPALALVTLVCGQGLAKKKAHDTASLVLGYDKSCWAGKRSLIAEVQAVPVTCEKGSCAAFQKVVNLPSNTQYRLDFSDLNMALENAVLVVTVCADTNKNRRCDEKPLSQVLRLAGKHFKMLYPEGHLTIDFHDMKGSSRCESL